MNRRATPLYAVAVFVLAGVMVVIPVLASLGFLWVVVRVIRHAITGH